MKQQVRFDYLIVGVIFLLAGVAGIWGLAAALWGLPIALLTAGVTGLIFNIRRTNRLDQGRKFS